MYCKLKESCSNCANSKLKCTKDRPTCKRCARKGLACEYLPSRRGQQQILSFDRPSSSSAADAALLRESSIDSIDSGISLALSELQAALSNNNPSPNMLTNTSSMSTLVPQPPPSPATAPPLDATMPFSFSNDWEWMVATPLTSPPVHCPPEDMIQTQSISIHESAFSQTMDAPWPPSPLSATSMRGVISVPMDSQNFFAEAQVSRITSYEDPPKTVPLNDHFKSLDSTTAPNDTQSQPHACISIVTSMLEKVYLNDNVPCALQNPNQDLQRAKSQAQNLSLHEVIEESRQTIDALTPAMECSCIQDELVVTLLPLVVLKILASYSRAARRSLAGKMPASPVRSRAQSFEHIANMSPEFLSQGNRNQGRIAASHVLSKMHKVQRLVNSLSVRIQASRANAAADPAAAVLSLETFERLEFDMKSRIQTASGEIIELLKRG